MADFDRVIAAAIAKREKEAREQKELKRLADERAAREKEAFHLACAAIENTIEPLVNEWDKRMSAALGHRLTIQNVNRNVEGARPKSWRVEFVPAGGSSVTPKLFIEVRSTGSVEVKAFVPFTAEPEKRLGFKASDFSVQKLEEFVNSFVERAIT